MSIYFDCKNESAKKIYFDDFGYYGNNGYIKLDAYDGCSNETIKKIIIEGPKMKVFQRPTVYENNTLLIKLCNFNRNDTKFFKKLVNIEKFILQKIHIKIQYYREFCHLLKDKKHHVKLNLTWHQNMVKKNKFEMKKNDLFILNFKIKGSNKCYPKLVDENGKVMNPADIEAGFHITPTFELSEISISENIISINWVIIYASVTHYFKHNPPTLFRNIYAQNNNNNNGKNGNNHIMPPPLLESSPTLRDMSSESVKSTPRLLLTDDILLNALSKLKKK